MAQELEDALGAKLSGCELVAGGGGIFEVRGPSGVIFSKAQTGRFPKQGEIAALMVGD